MKRGLIVAVATVLAAAVVNAEPRGEPRRTTGWFYAGLGFGSHVFAASAGGNVKHVRFLGTLRATFMGTPFRGFLSGGEEVYDVGLLFGYCPLGSLSVAAGIGWAGGGRYYEVDLWGRGRPPEYFDAVGVPIEVQFTPVKGGAVGLGIVGYANINPEESFGGVTVGIELGMLK